MRNNLLKLFTFPYSWSRFRLLELISEDIEYQSHYGPSSVYHEKKAILFVRVQILELLIFLLSLIKLN